MIIKLGRKKPRRPQAVLRGWQAFLRLLMLGGVLVGQAAPVHAELPVPCGSCAGGVWVTSGQVQAPVIVGNAMSITQQSDKAILNWQSFNVGADNSVTFVQPSSSAVALNRIYQSDPSRILGRVSANGQIYLINRNGILFGRGSQVDANTLVASTLDVADDVLGSGVFAPLRDSRPAFSLAQQLDANGNPQPGGTIQVEAGAQLTAAKNGRIMLLAPEVENRGTIKAPDGQVILAAGQRVWLADSDDPDLRGLVVEVDVGGNVRNLGEILVERGNASLVGLAVNQEGRVSAKTAVNLGGSIRLMARDTVRVQSQGITTERAGAAVFGTNSTTEVLPDYSDSTTAIDEQAQPRSTITAIAKTIDVQGGARVIAPSGIINFTATANPAQPLTGSTAGNGAHIDIAPDALLDVSGTKDVSLPMERNVLTVELRGNELKDSPLQRNGILYGKKVKIDVREGTTIADISGAEDNIQRGIGERTTAGGSIALRSEDSVRVQDGATLDVSGGSVRYESGVIETTRLVSDGRIYDIAHADPNLHYDAVLSSYTQNNAKWGVKKEYHFPGLQSFGTVEEGYVEGKDAGSLILLGNSMEIAGRLKADTVAGLHQRRLPAAIALPWTRAADELPLGGQLIFGDASQLNTPAGSSVNFHMASVLFRKRDDTSQNAEIPVGALVFDPSLFKSSGFTRVAVYSDGRIVLPKDEQITLAPGGELTLVAGSVTEQAHDGSFAPALQIDGDISAPAGDIELRTVRTKPVSNDVQQDLGHRLAVGADAVLDVNGQWVNDAEVMTAAPPTAALATQGGNILLSSAGALSIADGASLLLNGGAWLDRSGKINPGDGGDLTIGSTLAAIPTLHLGGKAESYGLVQGGTLSVTAPGIAITQTAVPVMRDNIWTIDPSFFQQGGFSQYNLTSTHLGLSVAADARIVPRATNWVLDSKMNTLPTGAPLASVAKCELLPDYLRKPVSVSLASRRSINASDIDAGLTIARGAEIDADAGASIALSSDRMLTVEGAVRAPAGHISLTLTANSEVDRSLVPDKAIWLGSEALLAAPAAMRFTPNSLGLRRGEVLDGGDVTLRAQRGFVVTESGSLIDVSGAATTLDIARPGAVGGAYEAMVVAGDAGTVQVEAPEGMILAGGVRAQAAAAAGAAGGTLTVRLGAGTADPLPDLQNGEFKYPTGARELALVSADPAALTGTLRPGDPLFSQAQLTALRTENNGVESRAVLSLQQLQQAGLDAIDLAVRPVVRSGGIPTGEARIRLDAGAELAARGRITLDAPILKGSGGDAELNAAYIALGPTDSTLRFAAAPAAGAGTLTAHAGLIDLMGDIAVQGFGASGHPALALESRGDVRLTGIRMQTETAPTGTLRTVGDMRIDAGQIYPTTLSTFTLEATGAQSTVALGSSGTGDSSAIPLSAGGTLKVNAPRIEVSGTVRAPHGRITLEAADHLALDNGSVVSVAGPALPVPYGQTQFGRDWVLPYDPSLLRVLGGPNGESWSTELPGKAVELVSDDIALNPGAQVVLNGGGDLYAWEFVPGPGGSKDVLLPQNTKGAFAILPTAQLASAPLDPFSHNEGLKVGDAIEIAGGIAGLPAGTYTLLPARDALLPGAFLLTPRAGATGLAPAEAAATPAGLSIVTGRRSSALAGTHESLWSGYIVETGAQVRQRAEYRESLASAFFADKPAAAAQMMPADAGRLVIDAGERLTLGATVLAEASAGGRGGQADIVADNLAVVAAATGQAGRVELTSAGLAQLHVSSLLLGGRRERAEDGVHIQAKARRVGVESGVEMELPQIILVAAADGDANDGVRVAAGATLRGVGAQPAAADRIIIAGDTALLKVSSGDAGEIKRSDVPAQAKAQVVLESGSTLVAGTSTAAGLEGGSIAIDSSGNATSAAGLILGTGGSLQLAASRISMGQIPDEGVASGLALSQQDLAGLHVSNLFLKSASSIDLFGVIEFSVDDALVLDAPVLRGIARDDQLSASFRAGTLTWRGAGAASEPVTNGIGQLTLAGTTLHLGGAGEALPAGTSPDSELAVKGFAITRLEGANELIAEGSGTLQAAGELQLASPWLTTSNGADWRMDAAGALTVTAEASNAARPASAGLGSRLALSGSQVDVDGRMLLPAGSVTLHATGTEKTNGIHLAAGTLIDVAAVQETFLDRTLVTPGGNVTLETDGGDVVMDASSRIDVSGADGALTVRAKGTAVIAGDLVANADGGDPGSFALTAQHLDDFSALNDKLNAGGFGAARYIHLRSGDMRIGAAETMRARDVAIVLDGEAMDGSSTPTGAFQLDGKIDASGETAGQVRVSAYGDLALGAPARIDTHASGEDRTGGDVELATTAGSLDIAAGAVIDVSGTREVSYDRPLLDGNGQPTQRTDANGNPLFDLLGQPLPALEHVAVANTGQVRYRVPRAAVLGGAAGVPVLDGTVLGAGRVELEAFQSYTDADGQLNAGDVAATASNPLYQDAADLMSHEADIRIALGVGADPVFHLVPGVEIRSAGNLTLKTPWDLSQWRFGEHGEPGILSLRAAGNLVFEQPVSDGVERIVDPAFFVEKDILLDQASWSLRLAAGADLNSVDPLMVNPGSGDVVVGAGALVRTGTGDIKVRAGRDLVLANSASVIYTAGIDAGNGTLDPLVIGLYLDGVYPVLGGNVDIMAGRDIKAAASDQLINDWLWRIGSADPSFGALPHAWNVSLTNFREGVAAFGGGTVSVRAGGDISNLSAAVPTTARQLGSNGLDQSSGLFTVQSDEILVQGGDALSVHAGGDIVGGVYYLGRGLGELTAGGSITRQNANSLYPMLGLGAGQWQATAGQGAAVETVFNPTLVTQALQQGFQPIAGAGSSFSTYADTSALQLTALAGDARLNQDINLIKTLPFFQGTNVDRQFTLYPGNLQATSFRNDVVINQSLDLAVAPTGQLALFADGNVRAEPSTSPVVTMLDAVGAAPVHGDDPDPVRIVAKQGDIGGERLGFNLAKLARLEAGGDIRNVRLEVQQLHDKDVTVLKAGGSIIHDTTRAANGVLGSSTFLYSVAGPGRVDFMAGGDIDLGTANGILTTGNTNNPLLPDGGAAVTVVAGLREPPRTDAFIDQYLTRTEYAAELNAYLKDYQTDPALGDIEKFRALPLEQQQPFLWRVFFAELRASGVEAATSGSGDYSKGFDAINTLFPEQLYAAKRPASDLGLLLSRITTLDGGDINILVPGGAANAGVATTSQLIKAPSELGIVVQGRGDVNAFVRGDFAVNQSRVFTLDGGDLLMWSSFGNIDAGRGAKSAIAAPPPKVTTDPQTGNTIIAFPPAIAGSGIRAVVTSEGVKPGDVYLFAPSGVVSAGDAGIGSAGNVTIGAVQVIGADNIDVGGVAVGVPVSDVGSLTAATAGLSDAGGAATKSAEESAQASSERSPSSTPVADAALNFLEVEVLGFGDDKDKNDDKGKNGNDTPEGQQ